MPIFLASRSGTSAEQSFRRLCFLVSLPFVTSSVQTFSHLFEDVPPPLSGGEGFVPLRVWVRNVDFRVVLRAALLTLLVFYWLELWASFRILPLQVLHVLMRAGHRPALRRAVDARVADILGGRAGGWQRVTTALEDAP